MWLKCISLAVYKDVRPQSCLIHIWTTDLFLIGDFGTKINVGLGRVVFIVSFVMNQIFTSFRCEMQLLNFLLLFHFPYFPHMVIISVFQHQLAEDLGIEKMVTK